MASEAHAHSFFSTDCAAALSLVGKEAALEDLRRMVGIRFFELRAESAYQQGFIGGFFHSYMGQEAIQTAALRVFGKDHWWVASYRCHALALLLGETPQSIMAELFGRKTGNAKGVGGSMHLFSKRMLGGFGIVAGQLPIATGAAFALKYQGKENELALCFLGDGAVAQGVFHESLNLASLWNLPCIYIIENNQWGMGTSVERAISWKRLAEDQAASYGMKSYTLNGMDYRHCVMGFDAMYREALETKRPILVEVVTERFRGHSISDPGQYRTKEQLKECMENDPLLMLRDFLIEKKWLTEEQYEEMQKQARAEALEAFDYAKESPWPDPITLEEGVYAP